MKKLFITLLLLATAAVAIVPIGRLMDFQGAWVSGTMYVLTPITGTNKMDAPVVTNSGHAYVLIQNVAESQAATAPGSNATSWAAIS